MKSDDELDEEGREASGDGHQRWKSSKNGLAAASQEPELSSVGAEPVYIASPSTSRSARIYRHRPRGHGRLLAEPLIKAAVVAYIVHFDVSVCIGHIREAIEDGNFAASNVEPPARPDDRKIAILPLPSWTVWKDDRRQARHRDHMRR